MLCELSYGEFLRGWGGGGGGGKSPGSVTELSLETFNAFQKTEISRIWIIKAEKALYS